MSRKKNDKKSKASEVEILSAVPAALSKTGIPLYAETVSAGFPSPAESYREGELDLNELLVKNPPATFFVRVAGDSMTGAGIFPGDILVVDRSIEPSDKSVVVAALDGEFLVKRLRLKEHRVTLEPENRKYAPIEITEQSDFKVWGVVTAVVHKLQ